MKAVNIQQIRRLILAAMDAMQKPPQARWYQPGSGRRFDDRGKHQRRIAMLHHKLFLRLQKLIAAQAALADRMKALSAVQAVTAERLKALIRAAANIVERPPAA